ncbi:LysR substrate-binding domain-containing protein [Nocardia sp. NPDC004568]|uniref:LysR substrate-binding domain-containing protein n=1 Tax=Nocardia sp. NPDC004568 TaxID=3154551 RepID=UPI0033A45A2E
MELRQLRYFVVLAEELHFGRAADRLFITTPTLSQQLKVLERELGTPLVLRGRRTELTPAGAALLVSGREVLRAADEAVRSARRAAGVDDPRLRLGLVNGAPPWLSTRIGELARAAVPGARTVLTSGTTAEQAELLAAGAVDLALLRAPVQLPAAFAQRPVVAEELGVLVSAGHPLADASALTPDDLDGHELILFSRDVAPGLHDRLLGELRARGVRMRLSDSVLGHAQMVAVLPSRDDVVGVESPRARRPGLVWHAFPGEPLIVTYVAAWPRDSRNPVLRGLLATLPAGVLTGPAEV